MVKGMFCKNCGSEIADGEAFCPSCGAATVQPEAAAEDVTGAAQAESTEGAEGTTGGKGLKEKLPFLIATGVVVVIALIILIACSGGSAKGAVKDYYKALKNGNTKKLVLATYSKDVAEELIDDGYDMTLKEFYSATDDCFDILYKGLKDEGKLKFEYEIKKIENVDKLDKLKSYSKALGVSDLEDFQDNMEDLEDYGKFDASKIKKAYIAEVKWSVSVGGETLDKNDDYMYIYKYKGDWYIFGGPDFSAVFSDVKSANSDKKFDGDFDDVIDDVKDAIDDNDLDSTPSWTVSGYMSVSDYSDILDYLEDYDW
jgi:hypothetical protein